MLPKLESPAVLLGLFTGCCTPRGMGAARPSQVLSSDRRSISGSSNRLAVTQGHLIQMVTAMSEPVKRRWPFEAVFLLALGASLLFPTLARAQTKYQVLDSFNCSTEGCEPLGAVTFDKFGRLYGTANAGGYIGGQCLQGCGTVFEMNRLPALSSWSLRTLHEFDFQTDGGFPEAGITLDGSGTIFGTVSTGPPQYDSGAVFQMNVAAANGAGKWNIALPFQFDLYTNGSQPESVLTLDATGSLYGTTRLAGAYAGIVYKLAPTEAGWVETTIYGFCQQPPCTDGADPISGVVFDAEGNLYGATPYGGNGYGVVYELIHTPSGQWNEKILWTFSGGTDGGYPGRDLIFDKQGNLYSTATGGGPYDDGVVFKLTPDGQGGWQESVIYGFPDAQNGGVPFSSLTMDAAGNMYGVSKGGIEACDSGCGVVYRLHPESNGQWSYAVLQKFAGPPNDGAEPWAGVTLDGKGNLFGTTAFGGTYNQGTVYEISP